MFLGMFLWFWRQLLESTSISLDAFTEADYVRGGMMANRLRPLPFKEMWPSAPVRGL